MGFSIVSVSEPTLPTPEDYSSETLIRSQLPGQTSKTLKSSNPSLLIIKFMICSEITPMIPELRKMDKTIK